MSEPWSYALLRCVLDPMGLVGPIEVEVADAHGDTVLWTLQVLDDGHELHDAARRVVELVLDRRR